MRTLRISKTKLTLGNDFIIDHFALTDKQNQNMTKKASFGGLHRVLTVSEPLPSERHIYALFRIIFVFAIFILLLPLAFRKWAYAD